MLDEALRAIAEPRRRDILRLIRNTELPAGEIASRFDVTRPAISQHLKILMEAELVAVRRQGTRRLYRARPEGLAELRSYLEGFWHDSLLKLAEAAEEEERIFYKKRAPKEWLQALQPLGTDWRKPFLEIAPYLIAIFAQSYGVTPDGNRVKNYYVQESVGIAT